MSHPSPTLKPVSPLMLTLYELADCCEACMTSWSDAAAGICGGMPPKPLTIDCGEVWTLHAFTVVGLSRPFELIVLMPVCGLVSVGRAVFLLRSIRLAEPVANWACNPRMGLTAERYGIMGGGTERPPAGIAGKVAVGSDIPCWICMYVRGLAMISWV